MTGFITHLLTSMRSSLKSLASSEGTICTSPSSDDTFTKRKCPFSLLETSKGRILLQMRVAAKRQRPRALSFCKLHEWLPARRREHSHYTNYQYRLMRWSLFNNLRYTWVWAPLVAIPISRLMTFARLLATHVGLALCGHGNILLQVHKWDWNQFVVTAAAAAPSSRLHNQRQVPVFWSTCTYLLNVDRTIIPALIGNTYEAAATAWIGRDPDLRIDTYILLGRFNVLIIIIFQ